MKKLPKHKNPTQADRKAHAPYNFVPLPEKVVTVEDIPSQDVYSGYTGYIECALTTESPLYTRAAMNPDFFKDCGNTPFHELSEEQKEQRARFFHLKDVERPVIPGSSLRGMVRSLVEIVGYGKMQWVTNDSLVFRSLSEAFYRERLVREDRPRHYTPLMKAGYLEKDDAGWSIQPAKTIGGTTFARIHHDDIPEQLEPWYDCQNARSIWVKLGRYDYQDVRGGFIRMRYTPVLEARASQTPGFQEAVLAYSGPMDEKRREAVIFPPDESQDPITVDEKMMRFYRDQISPEQQALLGESGALNPFQPVFYLMQGNELVFFGHVMLFRLPYENTPFTLVPEALKSKSSVDLAEAIFGFVAEGREDQRQPHAGRVFFTDAVPEPGQHHFWLSNTPIPLKVLSSPKPTAFQHYLTQQQPDKVDTGRKDKKGRPKMELRLDHYDSPPPHATTIRGHKLYWHQGDVPLNKIQESDREKLTKHHKQYTYVKPVRSKVSFKFYVHFENLRKEELGALLWALSLPGEPGRIYRHKLGMGKPLGMGTVAIIPQLHLADRLQRYSKLFDNNTWYVTAEQVEAESFIKAFETFVLCSIGLNAENLAQVERIRMLLAMLEWHEGDAAWLEQMRYMEIEHGLDKVNEYKDRPVLPDPLAVVAGQPIRPPTPVREQRYRQVETHAAGEIQVGTVKRWLDNRGFGFITQADGSEIFVHHTGIEGSGHKSLREGQRVEYTVGKGMKGRPQAQNVKPL